jgi:hypothetical protein
LYSNYNYNSDMTKILSTTTACLLAGFHAKSFGRAILTTMLVCLSFGIASAQLSSHPTLAIGSAAPDFSLPGVDGKTYSLQSFAKSKFLVIIFTCDHCPTAQAYEDTIKNLVTTYSAKNVAFVAISPNDAQSIRLNGIYRSRG